jgi:diamine N-acetyltransferase
MSCAVTKNGPITPTGLSEDSTEYIRLRPATLEDAPALALIGGAAFLEAFTWMLPGADIVDFCSRNHTAEAYAHYFQLSDTRITIAEVTTGAPVGYAMVTTPDLPSIEVLPSDIELKRIYLLSRFRSLKTPVIDAAGNTLEGVRAGQALMDAAIDSARTMRRTRLLLGTHDGNMRAITFYQRNGFEKIGTRTFQVGAQKCCDSIFAKRL